MSILMPADTKGVLENNARNFESRSLFFDRFGDPAAKEDERKSWFYNAIEKAASKHRVKSWRGFLGVICSNPENVVYAQLQSRLMVNMAGGVMENAGLCLDRFGMPYIPGSAVKGCARRAAMAALREWCESGQKPGADGGERDNLFKSACEPFDEPAQMLTGIASIFGWIEQDWSAESDLQWACGNDHGEIWKKASQNLATDHGWAIAVEDRQSPWKSLPNYAGAISFLPAYPLDMGKTGKEAGLPLEVPTLGRLELDVVTCHHAEYYAGKSAKATDTEQPIPVIYPAVSAGHVFAFAITPIRKADAKLVNLARKWLITGLKVFGLGAKTNAGYGWFECSEAVQNQIQELLKEHANRERAERERQAQEQRRRAEEAERIRQKQEQQAQLARLSPEERADWEIERLTDQQFDTKVRAFCKEPRHGGPTDEQKKAIVRALRGKRLAYWEKFKAKATKGELATIANEIRRLSKEMNLGRMP